MNIIVHTDGGARGNPGPAAVGAVIEISKGKQHAVKSEAEKQRFEISKRIGEATNNVAEYTAVIEALRYLAVLFTKSGGFADEGKSIVFYLDSTLVVNQLNGVFRVKDKALRELLLSARSLEQQLGGGVRYVSIPREQNRRADFLVNAALDR